MNSDKEKECCGFVLKVEGLNYSFQSSVILKMELILLKALGWHLNSVTTYSFVEMLDIHFFQSHLYQKLISPATQLLLQATLGMCENPYIFSFIIC